MVDLLRWDRCDAHLPWVRVSRHCLERRGPAIAHSHDFAEWCWVEAGIVQHRCGDHTEHLRPGEIRFLRPGITHEVWATAGDGVLVTVSLPGPLFAELEDRYRQHPAWPWPAHGMGALRLTANQLRAFDALVTGIAHDGQERCDAEWMIAGVLRALRGGRSHGAIPPWLESAVQRMSSQRRMAGGLAELIHLCGRSAPHVSRAVRQAYNCTATDLVHRLRCQYAARELRLGTRPIVDIASDCGYVNLGHFYRRFGVIFGCAPRAYRQAALGG